MARIVRGGEGRFDMVRKLMWVVLVIGLALIAGPFAIGLPDKADGGQAMIDAFEPIMDEANVDLTVEYYDDVFVPLGQVAPAMSQDNIDKFNAYLGGFDAMGGDVELLVPALAAAMGLSEAQVQAYLGTQFPAMAQMIEGLPQMQEDFTGLLGLMDANVAIFERVPAGLDHYKPLVDTMESQRVNYDKIAGLPEFGLFTWFFVVPGVLLVAVALLGLLGTRHHGAPASD